MMNESILSTARQHLAKGEFEESLYWFEQALGLRPDWPPALEGAGIALNALGRPELALATFRKLEGLAPRSAAAANGLGEALKQLGRIKEARQAFERAVALEPRATNHHFALAQIARFVPDDPRLAKMEALARDIATMSEPQWGELHFALAKAYADLGRHAEAFAHLEAGNAIRRRWVQYDEAGMVGVLHDLETAFTPALVAAYRQAGDPSEVPVFVVGMPRSGTTLVEQMLASHPKVFGAGEPMYLHRLIAQDHAGPDFPQEIGALSREAWRRFGSFYVTRLRADAPQAERIVDKLPANFMLVGLIHLALPRARIIHIERDPLDTCFSCYANLFSENIDYSYDLGELGRYYRAYQRLMAHWRRILPDGAMLEVRYEELVANFPAEARRIVEFCGLAWDDRCLSFHRTKRVVHTLSAAQVRQPLFTTSVGRAAPYRQWLGPLLAALGEA